jgi:elongation factor G
LFPKVATSDQQTRLSDALALLAIEDPSLKVEETDAATLLSGLGELHIEVTLDRIWREYGLEVMAGTPAVAYRETITHPIESDGLVEYDRTIGGTRLQAAVQLLLEPNLGQRSVESGSSCMLLSEPIVTISPKVREYLCLDPDMPEEDLIFRSEAAKALIQGCQGALKRGPVRSCALANVRCHIEGIDAEGGLAAINSLPGAIRAAAAQAVTQTLKEGHKVGSCTAVEPTMSVEVTLPADMVGTVLSDITGRRGTVGDVLTGSGDGSSHTKALVRGDVPLVEILGYANSLRSLTGGEAAFSAEYKGHSPCS